MPPELVMPLGVVVPTDLSRAIRDVRTTHPLVQQRWANLKLVLQGAGFVTQENEMYRTEARQQWLFAQGRTTEQCKRYGVPARYAREGSIVTNSWSAKNSAHGWTQPAGVGKVVPAACALDVVPLGADGKMWTKDDPWKEWYAFCERPEVRALGLIHFHKPGKEAWDKPHLQLLEWSDVLKKPVF